MKLFPDLPCPMCMHNHDGTDGNNLTVQLSADSTDDDFIECAQCSESFSLNDAVERAKQLNAQWLAFEDWISKAEK